MNNKRLVIGGPLDGQTLHINSDILIYPTIDISDDDFRYRKENFRISSRGDSKEYQFLIPEKWDAIQLMDYIVKRYENIIPVQDS